MMRACTKEYQIPNTNQVIKKGAAVIVPALAMQLDEKYYPDAKRFDPERFDEKNVAGKSFVQRPYMPFGEGPRACIGLRLGKMQTKVGIVLMLQNYKYELGAQHVGKEIQYHPSGFLLTPVDGIQLKVSHRNDSK